MSAIGPRPPELVDLFGSLPTADRLAFEIRSWGSDAGYRRLFAGRFSKLLGIAEDVLLAVAALPDRDFRTRAVEILKTLARDSNYWVAHLRSQGALRTVVHNLLPTEVSLTNDDLAELVALHPNDLIGFVRIRPQEPAAAATEIRRGVRELGLRGVTMTPFWARVRANEPDLAPIYHACADLGVPIWIHTSMNWSREASLSFEHPNYIDEVAGRYPELVILAGHGGWPWIPEMVAVAMRHPGVYIDFSAFRPRHLATPGTGWEMLWYALSRQLQDKVVFGSTWQLLGMPLASVLAEVRELKLDPMIERKWLVENACRALGISIPPQT